MLPAMGICPLLGHHLHHDQTETSNRLNEMKVAL